MLRRKNHAMPWMLSALLFFNSSFAVIHAEEETPAAEEEVQEVLEEGPVTETVSEEQDETMSSEEELIETEEEELLHETEEPVPEVNEEKY